MPRWIHYASSFLVWLLIAVCLTACAAIPPAPAAGATPAPVSATVPPVIALVATPATPTPDPKQAIVAVWEEFFKTTSIYESVSAQGRPGDKAWWIEQYQRFYADSSLAKQLEYIEFMFSPRSLGQTMAFVQQPRYTVQVTSCVSPTECTLKVQLQGGRYWAYDTHYKFWAEANPVEPTEWSVTLSYDASARRWKIN